MKYSILLGLLTLWLAGCGENKITELASGNSSTEFSWDATQFESTQAIEAQIESGQLEGSGCRLLARMIAEVPALEVLNDQEFCDSFLNTKSLFGRTSKVAESHYLRLRIYVPEESWITAIKLNFKDSLGNFGGVGEVVNNFYGHYNQWLDVTIDLAEMLPDFKNWVGEDSPLAAVTQFSLNPYCAHQADSSSFFVSRIELTDERPASNFHRALIPKPAKVDNQSYLFTFDDPEELRRQMAYRTFESSSQAMRKGVAGNETMAIRMRGEEDLNNIAWLPIISAVTGQPADFTKVKRIYFDYYLTPGGDEFDGSTLYLTTQHWDDILIDTNFYDDFITGEWTSVSVDLANLDLQPVKGENEVLNNVHELRLNLNYRPGGKNVEMWLDNFGWE